MIWKGSIAVKKTITRSLACIAILAVSPLLLTGCQELQSLRQIKQIQDRQIYDLQRQLEQKVVENEQLNRENSDAKHRIEELTNQLGETKKGLDTAQNDVLGLKAQVDAKSVTLTQAQADLEAKTKMAQDLAARTSETEKELLKTREAAKSKEAALAEREAALKKLKKELEQVQADSQKAGNDSEEAQANLKKEADELRTKIKKLESAGGSSSSDAEIEEAYTLLKASLKPHIDQKVATVKRDSRGVVVSLTCDYIFKSGVTDIDPDVNSTLDQIAAVYKKYPKKYVEVEGHTDNKAIANLPFADNWALASARADKVVRYLARKMNPTRLKASSAGQFRPVVGDGGPMDRRVEIVLTNHQ